MPAKPPFPVVTFDKAIAWAEKQKVVLPGKYYGELVGAAKASAFTVSGLAALEQITAVQETLLANMAQGVSLAKWKKQIKAGAIPIDLPAHRLENIFRTNIQSSYARGRCEQQRAHFDIHPYLLYDAVNDSRTRPAHAAMDGLTERYDNPVWTIWRPPNGYQCRCRLIALSKKESEKYIAADKARLQAEGGMDARVDAILEGPDKGWDYDICEQPTAAVQAAVSHKIPRITKTFKDPAAVKAAVDKLQAGAKDQSLLRDIADWKQIGNQAGSNPGGFFEAPDGSKWYVKYPADAAQAHNEVLTGRLYRLAGIDVPEMRLITSEKGVGVASRIIDGLVKDRDGLLNKTVSGVGDGFATDAWLANWDVVGLDYDNLLVKAGKVYRVDTGGGLLYRAQGALKGSAFGEAVKELDTLRNFQLNQQAWVAFSSLTDEEIAASIARVLSLSDDAIRAEVMMYSAGTAAERQVLAELLLKRKEWLSAKYPGLKGIAEKAALRAGDIKSVDFNAVVKDYDEILHPTTGLAARAEEIVSAALGSSKWSVARQMDPNNTFAGLPSYVQPVLSTWTSDSYTRVTQPILLGTATPEIHAYKDLLQEALEAVPVAQRYTGPVARGLDYSTTLDESWIQKHVDALANNDVIDSLLPASWKRGNIPLWGQVVLKMKQTTGKGVFVDTISYSSGENEVLMPRFRYRVIDIEHLGGRSYTITIEEL